MTPFLFFLLTASLASFVLGQLGRVSFLEGAVNGYLYEFFLFLYLIVAIYQYRLAPLKEAFNRIPVGFIFVFTLIVTFLVSLSKFTPQENAVAFLYTARFIFYFIFLVYVSFSLKKNQISEKFITMFMFFVGGVIVVSGTQFLLYPDLRNLFYLGWDEHVGRVFGLFLEPYTAASVFGMFILFLLITGNKLKRTSRIVQIFLLALLPLSLLTYSRGFYVSFFLTLSFLLFKTRQKKFLLPVVAVCMFTLLALFFPRGEGTTLTRTSSVGSRITSYKEGLRVWQSSPIFGVGYNRIRSVREETSQKSSIRIPDHAASGFHSSFLIILAATGIVGFIAYVGFLINLFYFTPTSRYYLMFLVIFSLFDNVLLHPFILFLFALTVAASTPSRT